MAITLVGTASGGNNNGGDVVINLPGSPASDDIVLVIGGHGNVGSNSAGVTTSGYNNIVSRANDTCELAVEWKRMGGSPDTSVHCKGSGSGVDATAYVVMVFRGVSAASAIDDVSDTEGNSDKPNSPSVVVSADGGAVITGFIQGADEANIDPPSGYNDDVTINRTETNPVTAGAAWTTVAAAGSENPSAWDSGTTAKWVAATVALSIAAAPATDAVFAATGTATVTLRYPGVVSEAASLTGTATVAFVGAGQPGPNQPFSMTGTFEANFAGTRLMVGRVAATGTGTATFVGSVHHMTSVREDIQERGAATVSIGH